MSPRTLRRQLFVAIRDLPYKIGPKDDDASCVAKAKLLGEVLTRIGLQCEIWKTNVLWRDTGLSARLLKLGPRPSFNHFFVKVLVPETGRWVIVDPTWDKGLAGTFVVSEWDGITDTALAYPSRGMTRVGLVADFDYRDFDPDDVFTRELNNWYRELRRKKL